MAYLNTTQELSLWKRLYGNYSVASNGCWIWNGKSDKRGYAYLSLTSKGTKPMLLGVYRAMYALFFGLPEKGLQLDHLCREPRCLNPTHLEPVTPQENQRRSPVSLMTVNSSKTECIKGHEFTEANTYRPPKRANRRECKTCRTERDRKKYL